MIDLLTVVPLDSSDLPLIRGLDCGAEDYQQELAAWPATEVERYMARGTRVWMYVNGMRQPVGYGSLGTTKWQWPRPESHKILILVIPALALAREFWGQPKDASREERYSSQMMRHLLSEATAWPGNLPAIGLYVHPANIAAIRLYERFGFQLFHNTYIDQDTQTEYRGYVRDIPRA